MFIHRVLVGALTIRLQSDAAPDPPPDPPDPGRQVSNHGLDTSCSLAEMCRRIARVPLASQYDDVDMIRIPITCARFH